jgi:energy-coupling factor transporter ATP-binding protein EcfA2
MNMSKGSEMVDAAIKDGEDKAEIERLAKLDDFAYARVRKEAAKKLGVSVADLNAAVKKAVAAEVRRLKKNQDEADEGPPPKTDEELEASARDIIDCENVLAKFAKEIGKAISGEERNAKIVYLNMTTRVFEKCNHTAVKGPSGCGKSELRTRVAEFMPPESVISFTALSEKALIFEKRSFEHKIVSMGEAAATADAEFQDYLLRELMSEGILRYPVVQKVDGELTTITIEKEGPVAFVVTTTRNALHPENETRLLSIEVDDSAEQTKRVLTKVAEVHGQNGGRNQIDLTPWQDFQRSLERSNRKVVVPYAVTLAELIPPSAVRLRRDFAQLLLAIKAHALIHRSHRPVNEKGEIVADIKNDYAAVRDIMKDVMAESSGKAVKDTIKETVDAVTKLMDTTEQKAGDTSGVTAQQVGRHLKLDKSVAHRRLQAAVSEGFVSNLETRRGQPGKYVCSGQEIESEETLPTIEKLLSVSIPSEILATVQPEPNHSLSDNDLTVADHLATGTAPALRPAPPPLQSGCTVANPSATGFATGLATVKPLDDKEKTSPVARLQSFRGRQKKALENGSDHPVAENLSGPADATASLGAPVKETARSPSLVSDPASDPPKETAASSPTLAPPDLDDIPAFLDRRRKSALTDGSD